MKEGTNNNAKFINRKEKCTNFSHHTIIILSSYSPTVYITHNNEMNTWKKLQGEDVEGGGEKKGMEEIMVEIEGMLGSELDGNGGKLKDGSVGLVGILGSGGIVSLGTEGMVGNGGTLPWGNVGIEGKGGKVVGIEGNVGFGKLGCVVVCKRLRASRLMFDKVTKRSKDMMKVFIEAMTWWIARAS